MGFVKLHQKCDDCGSSDALSYNDDGSSFCFSCGQHTPAHKATGGDVRDISDYRIPTHRANEVTLRGDFKGVLERGIDATTMAKYSASVDGDNILFGYHDSDGVLTAYKKRTPDKKFKIEGDWKSAGLFGQHLFPTGGQYITVVEGEFDALAAYQMFGGKYPVVSIRNGAQGASADCRRAYDFLDRFEHIIFCFDNDEHGKKAAHECADIFGGKAKIYQHGERKDANEYLLHAEKEDFIKRWWHAKVYTPDGMVMIGSLREELKKPLMEAEVRYPYKGLDDMTFGIRPTELVTICSGSGLGKSTFMRELVFSIASSMSRSASSSFASSARVFISASSC